MWLCVYTQVLYTFLALYLFVTTMGRIDAIISDELEAKLRIEIIKRFGGKKGDLQKAVEEAIKMWVNINAIEKLKTQATNPDLLPSEREAATRILGDMGFGTVDALLEIGNSSIILPSERDTARNTARRLLATEKSSY